MFEQAKRLNRNLILRLQEQRTTEYEEWNPRDLAGQRYVYLWADGTYVNVRPERHGKQPAAA